MSAVLILLGCDRGTVLFLPPSTHTERCVLAGGSPDILLLHRFFYGVFVIDCVVSFNLMNKVKKFAKENDLIVRVEELKSRLALDREKFKEKPSFLLSLHDTASIKRAFENNPESFSITKKIKLKAEQLTENVKEKAL